MNITINATYFKPDSKFMLRKSLYADGKQIALIAVPIDPMRGPYVKLTVALDPILPMQCGYDPSKHVIIKNYNEGEGVLECLIEQGVVSEPVMYASSGFIDGIPVCELLVDLKDY